METNQLHNLSDLNGLELKAFLNSFDNVLCDCDGVIWIFGKPLPNVQKSISTLKGLGKRVGAVTNNATRRLKEYQALFQKYSFDIDIDDLVYPTAAIIHYFKQINFEKEVFVIGSSVMREELKKGGVKLAHVGELLIEEDFEVLEGILNDNLNIGAVIVDYDFNVTYVKLAKAAVYLQRSDVLFIVGANDTLLPMAKSKPALGPHGFQKCLENFTGTKKIILGKPGKAFNNYVVDKFNIKDPHKTLFVGDSLHNDVSFAKAHGYQSLLVLTGVSSLDDAKKCSKDMVPDYYINSFGDIHTMISTKCEI